MHCPVNEPYCDRGSTRMSCRNNTHMHSHPTLCTLRLPGSKIKAVFPLTEEVAHVAC